MNFEHFPNRYHTDDRRDTGPPKHSKSLFGSLFQSECFKGIFNASTIQFFNRCDGIAFGCIDDIGRAKGAGEF